MTETTGRDGVSDPRLSVVMPAFDAERFLAAAIDSVLAQTVGDLELVVVDDGSTDDTWRIVDEYARRDGRVRGLRNEENIGIPASLNRGIEAAAGRLIGRMDADDVSLPHRFERQLAFLEEHPEVAVVGSYVLHMDGGGEILGLSQTGPASEDEFAALRREGKYTLVFGGTAVFSRRLVDEVGGYDPEISTAEDLELFDRMAAHGAVVAIPEPLVLYRIHPQSHVMRTFFHGRLVHRYVADRRRRQLSGLDEVTFAEFRRLERARDPVRRALRRLDDLSRYLYRRAGVEVALDRRWRALGFLVLSATTAPWYALPRIWSQRLSPAARRARRTGSDQAAAARSRGDDSDPLG
jgi:glycosyltransferase involved in cell wall biosynthesis